MNDPEGYVLLATILLPLATAFGLVAVPSARRDIINTVSVLVGIVLLGLSIFVFIAYQVGEGTQFNLQIDWIENVGFLRENGITLHLGIDGISAPMMLLNGIVASAGALVSTKIQLRTKDFFILFWALVAGVFGTFCALDLFFFFFFYELAVLPMYLLIAVWGSTNKEYGAMKLTMMLVWASTLIFIGIFATFAEAGLGTFDLPSLYGAGLDPEFQKIFFPFMAIGCGVLSGLWPFHTWSPDGHVAAPTAVSMLHAGVLMKLGAFGIIRLGIQLMPEGAQFWMPGLMVLGMTNVLYGAISAMAQKDLKFVIGYSSVSHMGYVVMGLATMNVIGINGAVLQMFSHGVMTALFFAMVGAIYDQAHTREIAVFGGLASIAPRFAAFFAIAGLTSLGLPGMSGFVAEVNIFIGLFRSYPVFAGLAVLAAAITAAYVLRLLATAFFGPPNPRWAGLRDLNRRETVAGVALISSILMLGLWPAPFIDRIVPTVESILRVS